MRMIRPASRPDAARKYDILTALGAHACGGDKHLQRLVLRFITLLVARYNWQTDELSSGQREIAALWSVDERTVKRDLARLRAQGWLVPKRAAARGRVAVYGLDLPAILNATRPGWARVGPDYVARMTGAPDPGTAAAGTGTVIAFPGPIAEPPEPGPTPAGQGGGPWGQAQRHLAAEVPALHAAWFAALVPDPDPQDQRAPVLRLRAPSRFHASFVTTHHLARLLRAAQAIDPGISAVVVSA